MTPTPKSAVVFNPATAPKDPPARRSKIMGALRAAGFEPRWFETTKSDPGEGVTRRAVEEGAELVFVAGGDGTIMACVTSLVGTGVPLALLPTGTGNLLAINLEVPLELERAVDVAARGDKREIDVGDVGSHRFVIMAGMGFDAAMLRDTSERLKTRIGPLAYVLAGLKHLRAPATPMSVRIDHRPVIRRSAHLVLIGNVGRLQGGLRVLPAARPDDGLLHVAIVTAGSVTRWIKVAFRVLRGVRQGDGRVEVFTARRVTIEAATPVPVQLDGDVLDDSTELTATVLPSALTLCVPSGEQLERMARSRKRRIP